MRYQRLKPTAGTISVHSAPTGLCILRLISRFFLLLSEVGKVVLLRTAMAIHKIQLHILAIGNLLIAFKE